MAYKIYKGSTEIKKLYVGNKQIKKVYKGSTLIYNAFEAPQINQPTFTSNTTNGITVDDHMHRENLYKLFNGVDSYYIDSSWKNGAWLEIHYPQQVVLSKYAITCRGSGVYNTEPLKWKIQGSDNGESWVDLQEMEVGRHGFGVRTEYPITIPDETKFYYYRIYFLDGVVANKSAQMGRMEFFTKAVG